MIRQHIEQKLGQPLTDGEFADGEFDRFSQLLHPKRVAKKEMLIREGARCADLNFVEKGALFSSLIDASGDAHVVQFALEGYWISDSNSFWHGRPALFTVEALEECQLLALSREGFQAACDEMPKFERFFRLLAQNAYASAQWRIARMFSASAEERYRELVERHPDIVQRVPQFLVASFLGVRPQSLSRIRRQIFEKR